MFLKKEGSFQLYWHRKLTAITEYPHVILFPWRTETVYNLNKFILLEMTKIKMMKSLFITELVETLV